MCSSYSPNSVSTAWDPNSTVCSSTKSMSHWRESTIRTKGATFVSTSLLALNPCLPSYETISDLMQLQDQIDSFQKTVFSHFRHSTNNECRISSLVPLVKESWGIYRFITSMLRAMYRRTSCSSFVAHHLILMVCRNKWCWSFGTVERTLHTAALQPAKVLLRMLQFEVSDGSHQCP